MKSILIREIPEELHCDFKAACAKDGVSMNQRMIELMHYYTYTATAGKKDSEFYMAAAYRPSGKSTE